MTEEVWTMDELVALTDEVQQGTISFRGKTVSFQFCELTESEEPKMKMPDDSMSEEDKLAIYQEIGANRVKKMLDKANEKNPDGNKIDTNLWEKLPTTLRYNISNDILGVQQEVSENFTL
jgi:type II secretory pathway component PulJ